MHAHRDFFEDVVPEDKPWPIYVGLFDEIPKGEPMKLYQTTAEDMEQHKFTEYASSASDASKARTRLKKNYLVSIETTEVEVETTRTELIKFLNGLGAHSSATVE